MEEVFGLKGDGHARHRHVIVVTGAVADIGANGKCNWFGLSGGSERDRLESQTVLGDKCASKSREDRVFTLSGTGWGSGDLCVRAAGPTRSGSSRLTLSLRGIWLLSYPLQPLFS